MWTHIFPKATRSHSKEISLTVAETKVPHYA